TVLPRSSRGIADDEHVCMNRDGEVGVDADCTMRAGSHPEPLSDRRRLHAGTPYHSSRGYPPAARYDAILINLFDVRVEKDLNAQLRQRPMGISAKHFRERSQDFGASLD